MNEEATLPERTEFASEYENEALDGAESEDRDLAANAAPQNPPAPPAPPAPVPEFHLPAVSEIKQQVGDTASQALTQAKSGAGQAYEAAKKQVSDQLVTQKNHAADTLGGIKNSFHQIGDAFAGNGQPVIGDYARNLGEQVDKAAGYLRDSDLETLGRDAQQFAKQNPTVVIGSAFIIGMALARFFKASEAKAAQARSTALVPYTANGSDYPLSAPQSRQDIDLDDAFNANQRPLTANGYVAGGVLGGAPA